MSSNGVIVIPKKIREALVLGLGDQFLIHGHDDSFVLKRLRARLPRVLKQSLDAASKAASSEGLAKSDVREAIIAARRQ